MSIKLNNILLVVVSILIGCKPIKKNKKFSNFNKIIDTGKLTVLVPKQSETLVNIKIPKENSLFFDYNNNLTDLKFIKLEKIKSSEISKIDKIFLSSNRIIVIDLFIKNIVYIFDTTGKFINKISSSTEYSKQKKYKYEKFIDVAFNSDQKQIILHDDQKNNSLYFDTDGNFIKTMKEYISFVDFANIKKSTSYVYLNMGGGNEHIEQLSKTNLYIGKENTNIQSIAPYAKTPGDININYMYRTNLSSLNSENKIFYTPIFSDTIYQINPNPVNVFPKLVLHFPGPNINEEIRKNQKLKMNGIVDMMNTFSFYYFNGFILSNDKKIFYFDCSKKGASGYFYSETNDTIIGGLPIFKKNTKDSTQLLFYRYPETTFQDYFISILFPSDFDTSNNLMTNKLALLKKSLKPMDNPILVFYKIKLQ